MSKEIKKTEKPELSEQELDQVAGGATYNTSKSNVKGYSVTPAVPTPSPPARRGGTNPL